MSSPAQQQHENPERQQRYSPPQIHIDPERALVQRAVAHRAKDAEDQPNGGEQHSDWQSNINSHEKPAVRVGS